MDYEEQLKYNKVSTSLIRLMEKNAIPYITEIMETDKLSYKSYEEIRVLVYHKSKDTIMQHFGLVYWYFMNGIKEDKQST